MSDILRRSSRLAAKKLLKQQGSQQQDVDEPEQTREEICQEADNASPLDDQSPLQVSGNIHGNAATSSHASRHKSRTCSTAPSSIRRLQAEAGFEAEKKLLDLQRQQREAEAELIRKELELKKLQIEEDLRSSHSQRSSKNSNKLSTTTDSIHHLRTREWIDRIPETNINNGPTDDRQTNNRLTYDGQTSNRLALSELNNSPSDDKLEKFMTRQTLKLDLPLFSDNPLDWPNFISQFKETTNICKLTNLENMNRLQKSLTGKARSTVQALLTLPNKVDLVISTLERRFGRPKYVIDEMISQTRKIPPFKEENLESIIDFANIIQNLTATIESLNCQEHLLNPQLLKELTEKLSCNFKLRWGERSRFLLKPNLSDFSIWIQEIADAACMVSKPKFYSNDFKSTKKGYKEFTLSTIENKTQVLKCIFCKKTNHSIEKCRLFLNKNVDERWIVEVDN